MLRVFPPFFSVFLKKNKYYMTTSPPVERTCPPPTTSHDVKNASVAFDFRVRRTKFNHFLFFSSRHLVDDRKLTLTRLQSRFLSLFFRNRKIQGSGRCHALLMPPFFPPPQRVVYTLLATVM